MICAVKMTCYAFAKWNLSYMSMNISISAKCSRRKWRKKSFCSSIRHFMGR